ncbi:hypothetical protein Hanom_Chr00s001254g01677891 [Helianthus anomalus]
MASIACLRHGVFAFRRSRPLQVYPYEEAVTVAISSIAMPLKRYLCSSFIILVNSQEVVNRVVMLFFSGSFCAFRG